MRLPLEQKLTRIQKLSLAVLKRLLGTTPGPVLVVSYRRSYFGDPWRECMQEGMRQMKHWRLGEVELFAAFVSHLNSCTF